MGNAILHYSRNCNMSAFSQSIWRENSTLMEVCDDSLQNKGFINIKAKRIENIIRCSKI